MTVPARRLFVPVAQALRIEVEPYLVTTAGVIASYRARVASPLHRYARRQQITTRQFIAGTRLYEDYAVGIAGARRPADGPAEPAGGGYSDARLAAIERYQRALCAAGKRLAWIAVAVAVEERWVADLAKEQHRTATELMGLLRVALDLVGDAYGLHE